MLSAAADAIRKAKRITVLTGAGVSAESGIPTFRDALTGLWENYDPEDLATEAAFRRNPQFVQDWYKMRREAIQKVVPNAGHFALAELQLSRPNTTLITQNVDGLHARAGSPDPLELHGNILFSKCLESCSQVRYKAAEIESPVCPLCGAWLRPDVVWFGEFLPQKTLFDAVEASRVCDVFLCVGTSALVSPAADLPYDALAEGAILIEINPNPTPLSASAHFVLSGPSAWILPEVLRTNSGTRARSA